MCLLLNEKAICANCMVTCKDYIVQDVKGQYSIWTMNPNACPYKSRNHFLFFPA